MSKREKSELRLTPELLLRAYAAGIFPMAEARDDSRVFWIEPRERGVLPLDRFHVPRSLKKTVRRETFEVRINRAFVDVIDGCAEAAPGRDETWINHDIRAAVIGLNRLGFAHSVETWQVGKDGEQDRLVGGLYGIALKGAFIGESMFSRATDASKVALVHLVARLRLQDFLLLDTQFLTDHLASFGGEAITSAEYQKRLAEALEVSRRFSPGLKADVVRDELERMFRR